MGDLLLSRLRKDIPADRRSSLTKTEHVENEEMVPQQQGGNKHESLESRDNDLRTTLDLQDLNTVVHDCAGAADGSSRVTMRVCCGKDCSGVGCGAALMELEELCQEYSLPIHVARTRCLGLCKVQGPNIGICSNGQPPDLHANVDSAEVRASPLTYTDAPSCHAACVIRLRAFPLSCVFFVCFLIYYTLTASVCVCVHRNALKCSRKLSL